MLQTKDFFTYIKKTGVQKTNRFVISMNIPDAVLSKFNSINSDVNRSPNVDGGGGIRSGTASDGITVAKALSLMAVDVNTPGQNISTAQQAVGVNRKIAESRTTGELNISFRCSGNMLERKLFDSWMSTIYRDDDTVAYYDDYITNNIDIFTTNHSGQQMYQVSMEEAYPTTITELPLNVENGNAVLMFQVTFAYRRLYNSYMNGATRDVLQPYSASSLTGDISASNLPKAPNTNNASLSLIDIYKNIERVKRAIETGSLSKVMGQKMILNIIRDINSSTSDNTVVNSALLYANNLVYLLGRK